MSSGGHWIIGDAHGCYHSVLELIQAIGSDEGLIFTGDLVDRGRHSRALVEMVIQRGYGHTAYDAPLITAQYVGIDTGCAFGRGGSAPCFTLH